VGCTASELLGIQIRRDYCPQSARPGEAVDRQAPSSVLASTPRILSSFTLSEAGQHHTGSTRPVRPSPPAQEKISVLTRPDRDHRTGVRTEKSGMALLRPFHFGARGPLPVFMDAPRTVELPHRRPVCWVDEKVTVGDRACCWAVIDENGRPLVDLEPLTTNASPPVGDLTAADPVCDCYEYDGGRPGKPPSRARDLLDALNAGAWIFVGPAIPNAERV